MSNPYMNIAVMAIVTYVIRALPLTLIRKQIDSSFVKSFLYYVPFVTLSLLVFPSILYSTSSIYSAIAGFAVAVILAYREKKLIVVSMVAVLVVYIVGILI
ncbi:AzlD domain-containing protein [Microaceticoccus formicicus]|uniref:AzlD domain-containing protein n=1 Tax=Microaceticoccus formicicus TaxID=3118105 RepID=UPI003CD03F7B|nr:AzlD domain-containing protein [Peptoniphilaceae bacterium AMB_02]